MIMYNTFYKQVVSLVLDITCIICVFKFSLGHTEANINTIIILASMVIPLILITINFWELKIAKIFKLGQSEIMKEFMGGIVEREIGVSKLQLKLITPTSIVLVILISINIIKTYTSLKLLLTLLQIILSNILMLLMDRQIVVILYKRQLEELNQFKN